MDAAMLGLIQGGGLCWSQCARCLRAAALDQLCVAHAVVCAFSSSLLTLRVLSLKGFAEIVTLLFFLGAYSTHVLDLLLLLWDSALSSMYGLSKMRLPHCRESLIIYC